MPYQVEKLTVYDLEVYPNYFLFGALHKGEYHQFNHNQLVELYGFLRAIQAEGYELCGWNSNRYDDPVLSTALDKPAANPQTVADAAYKASYSIIEEGTGPWNFPQEYASVDLKPLIKNNPSLKKMGVCLGFPRLQELPFDPHKPLTLDQMAVIDAYNLNDLDITAGLRELLRPQLELRSAMSAEYGDDLRSKSDAQIAEVVLVHRAGQDRKKLQADARENTKTGAMIDLRWPNWWPALLTQSTPGVKAVYALGEDLFSKQIPIIEHRMHAPAITRRLYLGDRYYKLGVGGLHSVDGPGCWRPRPGESMYDIDVASMYPSLMLTQRNYPRQWGDHFETVYREIYDQRLAAKASGDKVTSDTLKIVLNGTYGKTSDPYSSLLDPQCTANVTVIGQLSLLYLIALLTDAGHRVVSANTDGVTVISRDELTLRAIVSEWEAKTRLKMEYTEYSGLYQFDVNNYIAVKPDGGIKCKGRMLHTWPDLDHTPAAMIVPKAIAEYLTKRIPVGRTVAACNDINMFILTQKVTRPAHVECEGQKVGQMIRMYKSRLDVPELIRVDSVKGTSGRVPDSENCRLAMDLPETFPADIDLRWYTDRAREWLSVLTQPKRRDMNWYADQLGFPVTWAKKGSDRLSRRTAVYGSVDFDSLLDDECVGVKTGNGLMAKVVNGEATAVFRVNKPYPSRSRELITRDYGFTLHYGAVVPLPAGWFSAIGDDIYDMDEFYTEGELKKVRT